MSVRIEQRLGNYILRRLVGAGAFADVYLGMHIYLNNRVAIKVLHTHVNALSWESFLSEARHLSQLEHPHIIHALDFSIEDEDPFLVMDYAPGGNLRQRHPAGSVVPLPTVLSYVKTIAAALQYTHDQHLIHRDPKPENLLVGEKGQILLSDFGLALLTTGTGTLQVPERFGTLAYMAPEQIQGHASAASDQYALAVMVYEWLNGRRPFEGTCEQLTNLHLFATPAALRGQHPEVPAGVEQVLFRALSKEPAQRFVDVLSFATALEEACHPAAVSLSPSSPAPGEIGATEPARLALSGSHPYAHHLPVPLTALVGRDRELQLARATLLRPGLRLFTLVGSPGVGKTHLALQLAAQLQELFANGVCFVGLSTISDPNQVAPTMLSALGLPERKDATPAAQLSAYLREKRLLLVLDTFEQVLPAAPLLTELLSACPQLTTLVTSRVPLHVQGEYELTVPPLAVPDLSALPAPDRLAKVAAVSLFVKRVEALNPGFALNEQNAALIAELCVRLGGVPLALELAALRCKHLSLEVLLARLGQGLEVLSGVHQNVPSRQQTLRNTIAWSYDLLSAQEQWLFRRLCVFVGAFSLKAAEAVGAPPGGLSPLSYLDGVISLVDKSLLLKREVQEREPRLYLSEIIRAFGLEQLAACGELEDCRRAHAAYFLTLTEQHHASPPGMEQSTWLEQVEVEYANIRAALRWLLEHHERAAALRLLMALWESWLLQGRLSEGRAFLEQALEASQQDETLHASPLLARASYVAGDMALRQQDPESATAHFAASLVLFRCQKNKRGMAVCLSRLGFMYSLRGQVAQGKATIAESLALAREIGDRRTRAEVWHALGTRALYQGRYHVARKQLAQGLALFEAEGDVWNTANALHLLGVTLYAQQDYAQAQQFSEESLALLRQLGSPYGTSQVLTMLACELVALGGLSRAQSLLHEALELASTREGHENLVHVSCGRAHLELQQGRMQAAQTRLAEALTQMQGRWFDPQSKWGLARGFEWLAELALAQGRAGWTVQLYAATQCIREADGYDSPLGREQASSEHALTEARRQLGEKAYASVWAEGQALSPSQVVVGMASSPPLKEVRPVAQAHPQCAAKLDLPGGLSPREVEVLRLLAQGLSNQQLAEQLALSPYTVNSHLQSMYGKLMINSRSAATRFALDHHLL